MIAFDLQEQILDKLNTLIVVLNTDGSAEYISSSVDHLLGYTPEQLMGDNWWTKTRPSHSEALEIKQTILESLNRRRQAAHHFEHELRTAQGGRKWIRWSVSYLDGEQIVGIGHDITDKKLAEQKLQKMYAEIADRNQDITDSIFYARRIQESILPDTAFLKERGIEHFVYYRPKDIVSGDYYWFHESQGSIYVAAIDCTGHGVPGAMMSMVANSILKEVFISQQTEDVSEILSRLDVALGSTINRSQSADNHDGMDIGLIRFDKTLQTVEFAGAFRPLLIAHSGGGLTEIAGSRYPIGLYSGVKKQFEKHSIPVKHGDTLYLFTDGYTDQFGGEGNKKLNRRNFKELVQSMAGMDMEEQEAFLEYAFNNWKQANDQTDDILVIGFRIP